VGVCGVLGAKGGESMNITLPRAVVLERLDFMASNEASAIIRDTAEAAAAFIRAALEQPCAYPACPYPCPDLPDCKDAEQPDRTALLAEAVEYLRWGTNFSMNREELIARIDAALGGKP